MCASPPPPQPAAATTAAPSARRIPRAADRVGRTKATAITKNLSLGAIPQIRARFGGFSSAETGEQRASLILRLELSRNPLINTLSSNERGDYAESAMKIRSGLSVELEYELKVKGGGVLESSARTGPLRYVHGEGRMLPGLEKRLDGLEPGDERKGEIHAREAFGTEEMLPIKEMPCSDCPSGAPLAPGSVFEGKDPALGSQVRFKIISATD